MLKYITVILIVILIGLIFNFQSGQTGGAPFSLLSEKQMEGVKGSWSDKENSKDTGRPVFETGKGITYYGHGIPLYPVEPGPLLDPLKLPHNTNIATSPSCCPSPYSSDQGCYCGAIEDISKALTGR